MHALFYAEFDNVLGRKIAFQEPEGYICAEDFEHVSPYVITKPELCGRVVTVIHPKLRRAGGPAPTGGKIVAFPMGMQHEKYHRNSLMFAVGCVLDVEVDGRPYEAVLRKLGTHLYSMEVESAFLSTEATKAHVGSMLRDIVHSLNARGECFLTVGGCDIIALRLFPMLPDPPHVHDHDVPVRVRDLDLLVGSGDDSGWDLCMRHVLPHIDGVNYVRAIAECADVDVSLVKAVVTQLAYYGCVTLVDIFQYSNLYATQPRLQVLLRSPTLRSACLQYIRTTTAGEPTGVTRTATLPGMVPTTSASALSHVPPPGTPPLPSPPRPGSLVATAATGMVTGMGAGGATATTARRRAGTSPHPATPVPGAMPSPLLRPGQPGSGSAGGFGGGGSFATTLPLPPAADSLSLAGPAAAAPLPPLRFDHVFRLYAAFGAGSRTCDICAQGDTEGLGIDDRRFVAFGVMHGFLRRIHKYPIPTDTAPSAGVAVTGPTNTAGASSKSFVPAPLPSPPASGRGVPSMTAAMTAAMAAAVARGIPRSVAALLNGFHSLEEVCCKLRCSQDRLESMLEEAGGFVFVYK